MSSDTSAPSSTAPSSAAPSSETAPRHETADASADARPTAAARTGHGRHEPPRDRSNRLWTWVIAAASVAFCVALVLGATRLFVDTGGGDVTDTPERTVDAFLEALLDQRDADAAATWLCADKADRDLSEAVAALSFIDGPGEFAWGAVEETGRSVGAATVTAEISVSGDDAAPTTWAFSLVAEEGEPQWLICGITAE
ncbi:hypothetical protein [Glycomyces sp. NPDC048151]|uniref:hypothetical protein n=1 Tax=Glycomyces sp. NPDC048151 TaxID=3364002 RepID=UPI00372450DF